MAELAEYKDVLLGRSECPIDESHVEALMEYASTVLARGQELTMELQAAEREGRVTRGSGHQKFRTGELRTFCELAKQSMEMGSRRITLAVKEYEMQEGI